jgi:uncharacterized protein YbbK (DUF523 family)
VLTGAARVVDKKMTDHTGEILEGVEEFVRAAKSMGVTKVILKTKSPTCGYKKIHDGTFTGKLINGNGVLSAALIKEGIRIYTEENFEKIFE